MVLSAIPDVTFVPNSGIFNQIFHQTWIQVAVLGAPNGGYRITLIGLIIITLLALLVNAVTERLTSAKPGGLFVAIVITIIGAILAASFINLPFDFAIEHVRIIAALLGAIIIAVFYTLIRGQFKGSKK
jgi:uncharacterized membrane protein YeaQ/YmgE (transglycosylase-associated protein family)